MPIFRHAHIPDAVGCIATDPAIRRSLFGALPSRDIVPRELRRLLRQTSKPRVLVVSSCAVDDSLVHDISAAAAKGLLPTLVVACCRAQAADIERSWRLGSYAAALVTSLEDLPDRIADLLENLPQTDMLSRITSSFGITSIVLQRGLGELAAAGKPMTVAQLGRQLGVSRAALYRLFEEAGLPAVDKVALLFRLARSAAALSQGAPIGLAAEAGGYASERSLQRAFSKIGFSVAQARSGETVFDAWHRWAQV